MYVWLQNEVLLALILELCATANGQTTSIRTPWTVNIFTLSACRRHTKMMMIHRRTTIRQCFVVFFYLWLNHVPFTHWIMCMCIRFGRVGLYCYCYCCRCCCYCYQCRYCWLLAVGSSSNTIHFLILDTILIFAMNATTTFGYCCRFCFCWCVISSSFSFIFAHLFFSKFKIMCMGHLCHGNTLASSTSHLSLLYYLSCIFDFEMSTFSMLAHWEFNHQLN